jgi:putative chitinase
MLTETQLAAAIRCPTARAARWLPHLVRAMNRYGITTRERVACFLAQLGHESAGLSRIEENLNYSAQRLLEVFPRYFDSTRARQHARQPERIANRVYASRMGNGDERSGDGWMFRGRSPIQLTGRSNYAEFGRMIGPPLEEMPALALEPEIGAEIAAAYWRSRGLNALADAGDVVAITRAINGGRHGLADRIDRTRRAKAALEVA